MTARFSNFVLILIACFALAFASGCATSDRPDAGAINLLARNDLNDFHTFLESYGGQDDPNGVFNLRSGVLRISGQELGNLTTQREFANYRLVAEYKWGGATWKPREFQARHSGIIFNMVGPWKGFPKGISCQIVEGGTGSIVLMDGAMLKTDGITKGPAFTRIDRPGRNPWKDELGYRGQNEIENPPGEWNTVEILNTNSHVVVTVNGHKTFEATDVNPSKGKISLQSDNAEIYFRRLDLYPVK